MDEVQVEVIGAEGFEGLVETLLDAVLVSVPSEWGC